MCELLKEGAFVQLPLKLHVVMYYIVK